MSRVTSPVMRGGERRLCPPKDYKGPGSGSFRVGEQVEVLGGGACGEDLAAVSCPQASSSESSNYS